MAVEIKVPDMGESVIEASVVDWLKHEGDHVSAGEAVVALETDKITLEVSAPQAGVLQRIAHQVGETVAVGDVLAVLVLEGEPFQAPSAGQPAAAAPAGQPAAVPPAVVPSDGGAGDTGSPRVTPVAQRMALDLGVDLTKVTPSGASGRITKEDVQAYLEKAAPIQAPPEAVASPPTTATPQLAAALVHGPVATPTADARGEERVRMTRRRQTIARRLVEVQQVTAMLTTFNEIDMSKVIDLRKRRREAFKERFGVDLGYMSFFVRASIGALKAFPNVNAEIEGDEIVQKKYYDIGIAIGAEEGLVVPVLRDADRLNFPGIEKAVRAFIDKSKSNTLTLEDLRGGTFTITNGGVYGSLMSTPILNPPQVGILGMHAIKDRPVVVDGQMVIRPMMYVALSYDHRVVDGREAVQFLVRIKDLVEDPEALLFG